MLGRLQMDKVYIKSEKAMKELKGDRTLSLKQRQLVIMANGRRPLSYFTNLFTKIDVKKELADLEKLGFIVDKSSPATPAQKLDNTQDLFEALSPQHLSNIKYFLIMSLNKEVGIMGSQLAKSIEQLTYGEALKPFLSQWHTAIRDAKSGRKRADELVGQLNQLLANPDEANALLRTLH